MKHPRGCKTIIVIVIRIYLIRYILCLIECHICQNIFGRIDIMYCRLPYVSRCV
jgi:hypothetical protein